MATIVISRKRQQPWDTTVTVFGHRDPRGIGAEYKATSASETRIRRYAASMGLIRTGVWHQGGWNEETFRKPVVKRQT